ncbi:MAG: putative cobalamin binding protein [Bacteroidetes bacterium]|jgi:excisionase family DNA binding protein|nr:putative cobalamin binding protein [Bacteroidota bacterium]
MPPKAVHKAVLSTVDVARLFNVTETTVKRWADEGTLKCQKTPGGHRKFQIRNVVEFAEVNHFEPTGALTLPGEDQTNGALRVAILERDFQTLVHTFVEKALSPDRSDLRLLFSYLYEHRIALWEIYDLVLKPGMAEIGERWMRGEISIAQEHRASYETLDALAKLQSEILMKLPTGHSILFACLDEEVHEIGLRCAAYLFEAEGWQTHYLGARTPVDSICEAMHDLHPDVVAISVTTPLAPEDLLRQLSRVGDVAHNAGTRLLIGGSGVPAAMRQAPWHDGVMDSGRALLTFIEQWTAERRAQSPARG